MNKNNTISKIMKKHHYKLERLLNRIKKSSKEYEVIPKVFNKLKWELRKHFVTEEKAIFTFIYKEDQEIHEMKDELLKEHRIILKELDKIEAGFNNNEKPNLDEFQNLLIKHRDFEDETFYPKLDEELDEVKKKEIIDRINTPV